MHIIRNDGTNKAVTFVGAAQPVGFSGTVSQISWDNGDLRTALHQMFAVKPNEVLVAIEISDYGIKAQFA